MRHLIAGLRTWFGVPSGGQPRGPADERRSPNMWLVGAVLLLSLLMVIASAVKLLHDRRHVEELTIAAASKGGEYYRFAEVLSAVVNRHISTIRPKMRLIVRPTSGSAENMHLLADGEVDLVLGHVS